MKISFEGKINLDKPLGHWQIYYLQQFLGSYHVKRDSKKLSNNHWLLKQMKLPKGIDGEYYFPTPKPIINCTIKDYKKFKPNYQTIIVTLFCIQKYHYSYLDKNIFVLIANILIKELFLTYTDDNLNKNLMNYYSDFYSCLKSVGLVDDTFSHVIDYNKPPETQPGQCCLWMITDEGTKLEHNTDYSLHYDYPVWLKYLIENFFDRWGYKLNGKVCYHYGNTSSNATDIIVTDSIINEVIR
jgi:hypothetical protein